MRIIFLVVTACCLLNVDVICRPKSLDSEEEEAQGTVDVIPNASIEKNEDGKKKDNYSFLDMSNESSAEALKRQHEALQRQAKFFPNYSKLNVLQQERAIKNALLDKKEMEKAIQNTLDSIYALINEKNIASGDNATVVDAAAVVAAAADNDVEDELVDQSTDDDGGDGDGEVSSAQEMDVTTSKTTVLITRGLTRYAPRSGGKLTLEPKTPTQVQLYPVKFILEDRRSTNRSRDLVTLPIVQSQRVLAPTTMRVRPLPNKGVMKITEAPTTGAVDLRPTLYGLKQRWGQEAPKFKLFNKKVAAAAMATAVVVAENETEKSVADIDSRIIDIKIDNSPEETPFEEIYSARRKRHL